MCEIQGKCSLQEHLVFPESLLIKSMDPAQAAKLPWSPAELYIKDSYHEV